MERRTDWKCVANDSYNRDDNRIFFICVILFAYELDLKVKRMESFIDRVLNY